MGIELICWFITSLDSAGTRLVEKLILSRLSEFDFTTLIFFLRILKYTHLIKIFIAKHKLALTKECGRRPTGGGRI